MGFKTLKICLIVMLLLCAPTFVWAQQDAAGSEASGGDNTGEQAPEVKKPLTAAEEAAKIEAEKKDVESRINVTFNRVGTTDPNRFAGRIVSGAMGLLGSLTLVMFVYSGFLWMTAAGDAGKSEKARDILVWSSLGLIVIFSSYAIVRFVLDIFPN